MTQNNIIYYLVVICFFVSCSNSDSVDAILKKMSEDGTIDETEIKQLQAKPQKFKAILTKGEVDNTKFQRELTKLRLPNIEIALTITDTKKPVYNVFLENSGSMDGYVKGRTSFESSIYNFLSDINTNNNVTDSLNLFYINSEKIDFPPDVKDFIEKLEPSIFRKRGGNRKNSDIEMIVNGIITEMKNNDVSVFISDCLFSLTSTKNVEEYLINQSIGIKNVFAEKLNQDAAFGALVIQLSSDFTGRFYTHDNKVVTMNKEPRPYYVWVMGNHQYIKDLMTNINLESSMKGNIKNYYCWSASNTNSLEYRTTTLGKIGNYNPDRKEPLTKITDIKKASREPNKGNFQFGIAMDLKGYGLHPNYINDKNNYAVSDDNYKVFEVRAITDKEKAQVNYLVDYSHLMMVKSKRPVDTNLEISLKQVLPKWIGKWNWEPENGDGKYKAKDELTKSFGLKYLLEGVDNAYKGTKSEKNNFFTMTINIED
jgi:hypothetical protein